MKPKRLRSILLALCLMATLPPAGTVFAAGQVHRLNEANNWQLPGDALIEPGDSFVTVEKESETIRNNPGLADTKIILHEGAELRLDDMETDASRLIRSTADVSKIQAASTAQLETIGENNQAGSKTVTNGYLNNTGLPFTIFFTMEGGEDLGTEWLYSSDGQKIQSLTEISMRYKSAPAIIFYEPFYLVSYEGLEDGENQNLPDRIYVDSQTHTFRLPILEREGQTFSGWDVGGFYSLSGELGEGVESGGFITYSYSFQSLKEHNFSFSDLVLKPSFSDGGSPGDDDPDDPDGPDHPDYTEGWSFDESTGALTITSDEGMENWYETYKTAYGDASDTDYRDQSFLGKIKSAVLAEGVTGIRCGIFKGCASLTSVQIPSSVSYIDNETFAYCSSLTSLNIPNPDGVTVGIEAFKGCTALLDVTFGTTNAEYPLQFNSDEHDDVFYHTNPNLKIYVNKSVEQAVKELLPAAAHRVNTTDTAEYYGLVVNGEHISDKHLTVQCGSGTAVFDPKTSTLTLSNAAITKSDPDGAFWWPYPQAYNEEDIWHPLNGKVGIFSTMTDLNIVLKGTNTITDMGAHTAARADGTAEDEAHPIYSANGSVRISGDGTLVYADGNNDTALAELYFEVYSSHRSGNVTIDGVTLQGKYRIGTSSNCSVALNNATLEDTLIQSGSDLTITNSTVNCNKLAKGYDSGLFCGGNISFHYSKITLNDPITGYGTLTINGGYVKVDLTGQSVYRPLGGVNTPIYLIELDDIHLGANTKVTKGSFDRSRIDDEVLIVEGPSERPLTCFTDVKKGAYYEEAVAWAVNHTPQITNGTSNNKFSPDTTCTRGQVVTFLWRAMGEPEPKTTINPFTDVKAGTYYYKAVLWANEKNITNGTGSTTFSPDAPCTRGQVVTFLWRAEGKPAASGSASFSDVPAGQYYTDAVAWAVGRNITNGTGNNQFSPGVDCNRGQIVTFLYRDMG